MANEIVGTAGFNCIGKDGSFTKIIHQDITVNADWRSRPSAVLELFAQEAKRLSRITGRIGAAERCHRTIFNGEISNYRETKRGDFTCDLGNGNVSHIYHDVYTLRIKNEAPEETHKRLVIDAQNRHRGLVVLDCKGSVKFTGQFMEPNNVHADLKKPEPEKKAPEPEKKVWWGARFWEIIKDVFAKSAETRRQVAETDPGWSYNI